MDVDTIDIFRLVPPSFRGEIDNNKMVSDEYPQIRGMDGKQELIVFSYRDKWKDYEWNNRKPRSFVGKLFGKKADISKLANKNEASILRFERIIRLTWGHFLCIDRGEISLYFCRDYPVELTLLAEFRVNGKITLEKVLEKYKRKNPEGNEVLAQNLVKDNHGNKYISNYRSFVAVFSYDIFLSIATLRAKIDNDFNKSFYDVYEHSTRLSHTFTTNPS